MSFRLENVQIVFFSGTGGSKRIAVTFRDELLKRGSIVNLVELGEGSYKDQIHEPTSGNADFYILIFPVYAFDAPGLIYRWVEAQKGDLSGKEAAVISVSGGGEVWPNTGCRNGCCKALEKKGFTVVYDRMMCMPANLAVEFNDDLVAWTLRAIPDKAKEIVEDLSEGVTKRTKYWKGPLRNYLTKLENRKGYLFAKDLIITDECISCGWCASHCPVSNIQISEKSSKPVFMNHCMVCMRCVYGCPVRAIQCNSSVVFQKGFDLDAVEKRMEGRELKPVKQCCKGLLLVGVKKYLLEK
jgi:Pyruvate/2-oxoacid:ferredoxin oxidoreductase delta subunit